MHVHMYLLKEKSKI